MTPLLAELRSGHVVANLEALTASAADAAREVHKLQNEARQPRVTANLRDRLYCRVRRYT